MSTSTDPLFDTTVPLSQLGYDEAPTTTPASLPFTSQPLYKLADRAASEALGAQRLFDAIAGRLNAETYAEARAFCESLSQTAKQAQARFVASTGAAQDRSKKRQELERELMTLHNHPKVTRHEKLSMKQRLAGTPDEALAAWVTDFRQELTRRVTGEQPLTVVGEVFLVQPSQQVA